MNDPQHESPTPPTASQRILNFVEAVGNKVPHPAIIFLILTGLVVLASHVLYITGASVSYDVVVLPPESAAHSEVEPPSVADTGIAVEYRTLDEAKAQIETRTTPAKSLLTADGIRFIYTSLIPNFMGFNAIGLLIVAMIGAGLAEEAGLVNALIHKLVMVSPRNALTYILVFLGIMSSVAADAGYLVLIPLAGTAFISVGRHPLAGIAAGFAAVGGAFTVNMVIKPLDAVLTEFTNDAIHLVDPTLSIDLGANLWFSIASVLFLTVVISLITELLIEPRLGVYVPAEPVDTRCRISPEEARGLKWALGALLGSLLLFGLLTLPAGAPLRNPQTGALIGNSPFMNGLIAVIMVLFLSTGIAFGTGVGKFKSVNDVINAIVKSVSSLGGTIFLMLIISQFVAYFNYSNIPTLMAVSMSSALVEADIGPFWLLIGFIGVVTLLDLFFTPAIAKWAIFAPVFVPLFVQLGVAPEAVLAAYRIGDGPMNAITPLNAYFALVVGFSQKYDKQAGVGTIVSLMLPYVVGLIVLWTLLFAAWFLLGLPWGI
ncbi:AbgT family transporter [Planctomicrobium piriforme]|uniref:Aminobenzoyl-glutamate transport protein n=1 Tax=Planctomicrobium piriforme TaxID=1576369 RepID=A0A1I3PY73_9PLAN|nr:AbgT family transporter [Planctomicrobium piriforme]SFJ26370.1 aminobenzoyl-glutamate transport protein [Planctomicrobium piriforme]